MVAHLSKCSMAHVCENKCFAGVPRPVARVKRVYRACVVACQPCAGGRRGASAIAMSGSNRGTNTFVLPSADVPHE